MNVSEAFMAIVELGTALGIPPLCQHVGCWEHRLDDRWFIAVNGHRTPMKTAAGVEVPPFTAYVERDGWPAGLINPSGGAMVGYDGEAEDELIAALRKATELREHAAGETSANERGD